MTQFGGMQLIPRYRNVLVPMFLRWYLENFKNTRMMYGHWPVECKDSDDSHYHRVVIDDDNGGAKVCNNTPCTEDLDDHTYGRNTNACALALGGFTGATTSNLGANCATPAMIDLYVSTVAETACNLRSPVGSFMSHGEAADNIDQAEQPPKRSLLAGTSLPAPWMEGIGDTTPYGPNSTWERWDLHCWINVSTRKLYAPNGGMPTISGLVYFPDYIRGEAMLQIQTLTSAHWKPSPIPPE